MAVTRALIGGGGAYSYILVLPDEFLLKLTVMTTKYRVYKKKLNKPEIAHRLCKAPQCTKFFIEIGCLGTDNVV